MTNIHLWAKKHLDIINQSICLYVCLSGWLAGCLSVCLSLSVVSCVMGCFAVQVAAAHVAALCLPGLLREAAVGLL